MTELIKTTSYDQGEIIRSIMSLQGIIQLDLDPTYSKGVFYKDVAEPRLKFDLYPQTDGVLQASAESLPLNSGCVNSIMFDPPFLAGYTKSSPSGLIGKRFHGFRYMADAWSWYEKCLIEFHRILRPHGTLIIKCQDTISSGKQWLSHVHVINTAERIGFYTKDLYVLLARSRMIGHNHANQKHARKFHSYFLVFEKGRR